MEKITGKLTIFFDTPFWVGVFERVEGNKLSVCRVVVQNQKIMKYMILF